MKDIRQSLKPRLLDLIAQGREAAAAPFKPEALRETLSAMAKLGFDMVKISPTVPVDVRKTDTAKSGRLYLEREGIDNDWEGSAVPSDEKQNPSRIGGEFYDLVIRLKR